MRQILAFYLVFLSCGIKAQQTYDAKIYEFTLSQIEIETFNQEGKYYLDDLLDKFFNSDTILTREELVMMYYGFSLTPFYKPYLWMDVENRIVAKNDERQFQKAKELADSLTNMCPVSLMAHEELSYCSAKLKDTVGMYYHKKIYEQLLDVVLHSGDGLTLETSYKIIGFKDISVITQVKGMQVTERKKVKKGDKYYEKVTAFYKYEKQTIWFDITLIETLGRKDILDKKKKKKKK